MLAFVVAAVNGGFLKSGDVLLADNASIHKVPAMMLQLKAVPRCVYNIEIVFLPVYSPEFNPCELVFSQVKRGIWASRDSSRPFLAEINDRFAAVTGERLFAYYCKCLDY